MKQCSGRPIHTEDTRCNVCSPPRPRIDIIADPDHIPDIDNLISIAKSLMDLFWFASTNPVSADEHLQDLVEKHGIERDVCAFCYTFSILLKAASKEATREWKEEVRGVTSSMLRILKDDTELVANATMATHQQLYRAMSILNGVKHYRCKVAVAEGLVRKLEKLRDLILRKI